MTKHGHFHWNELMTRDPEQAKKFYRDTIGWSFEEMEMPGGRKYVVAMDGEDYVGGIFDITAPDFEGVPEYWAAYLAVDDVDRRLEKAKAAGATVVREPFDVAGVGRIVILKEPGGAVIGWMTPAD